LSWAVIAYLKEDTFEYNVKLNSTLENGFFGDAENLRPGRDYQADVVLQKVVPVNTKRDLATYWWRYDFVFYCFWGGLYPTLKGQSLEDRDTLHRVESDLNRSLRRGLQAMTYAFDLHAQSNGILGLSLIDPLTSDNAFADVAASLAPTVAPSVSLDDDGTIAPTVGGRFGGGTSVNATNVENATYVSPLNAKIWVSHG